MSASAQPSDTPVNRSAGQTLEKAGAENFPVAPFFLPAAWRDDLMAVYGFARLVDDAGDGDLADPAATAALLGIEERPPATPSAQPGLPAPPEVAFRLALLDGLEHDLDRAFETALHPSGADRPRHPCCAPWSRWSTGTA
ncbi:Squalene/phytoene synthase [Streptomyces sp. 1331.2]|nr:Squalene/phytoene synthase [Streptomyces sp. 1331.2]